MKTTIFSHLIVFSLLWVSTLAIGSEGKNMEKHHALNGAKVRAELAGLETDISGARWQLFTPVIDTFLKEHLFADLFVRDVISHQDRELTTIAALANMNGTEGQLRFHLGAAMNTGLTRVQMKDFISVLNATVGKAQAESAQKILTKVLNNRK